MNRYLCQIKESDKRLQLSLKDGFQNEDWTELVGYCARNLAEGFVEWEIDMTHMTFITSLHIGILVSLNTLIAAKGGTLKLVVKDNTSLAKQVRFSRIDQIVTCEYV